MQIASAWAVLLTVSICKAAAQEALPLASIGPAGEGDILGPLENRNGWVNPEDLIPMPQCIAQQDQSHWLGAMTKCTRKQCTSHFGVICTHHQWLTQLSCLSIEFPPDVVRVYLPYCSRSVLAKAQLFRWVSTVTGRTWLAGVGDANELQKLSPASLVEGYAAVDVIDKAPTCLTDSASAMGPFQYVLASCGFTASTRHTGNAARPWEYRESLNSIIALDFETVGYDLTQRGIAPGDYFDRRCFCKAFRIDLDAEPCSEPGLALTRERLWLNATCGPTSLPGNWTNGLKTTKSAYIPMEHWHWPACVISMPRKVIGLVDRCTTDACEVDSAGYCNVKRAVDRACFCRNINYSTCKGSCHVFETRIEYVKWLHDLCGNEQGWHGLPKDWRQLAAPTPLDMIPWKWSIKPLKDSDPTSDEHSKFSRSTQTCPSTEWKLGSLVLITIATLFAGFRGPRAGAHLVAHGYMYSESWFLTGLAIASLHLFANWINAILIQSTDGFENIPIIRLMLLWCSMPRVTWVTVLLVGTQSTEARTIPTVASCLIAEAMLQGLSAFHMIATVDYGRRHDFYSQGMERLEMASSAEYMYAGALVWLVVIVMALIFLVQAIRGIDLSAGGAGVRASSSQTCGLTARTIKEELIAPSHERWKWSEESLVRHWIDKGRDPEGTPLMNNEGPIHTAYGTLPDRSQKYQAIDKGTGRLFVITIITMILLWIAQWLFWAGFIGLGLKEFCPPKLGLLTVIWIASSSAVAVIAAIPSSTTRE